MDIHSYLKGSLLLSGGKFCNLDNFVSKISAYLDRTSDLDHQRFLESINNSIGKIRYKIQNRRIGVEESLLALMADDLSVMCEKVHALPTLQNPIDAMDYYYQLIMTFYNKLGIQVNSKDTPYFIVNNYPKPYDHVEGAALCPDKSDYDKYNIQPGIYFRVDKLIPVQSYFTLAHEIIHFVIAKTGHELLARGLEEGICEFMASYCISNILGVEAAKNYLIYRRLKYSSHNQRFKLYMDYFRSTTYLYNRYGLDGLVYIINSGRKYIKELEIYLSNMDFIECDLPSLVPRYDPDFSMLANYISLTYPEHEVVSPLAYWICNKLGNITSTNNAIEELNLDPVTGKKAIEELEVRVFAVLLEGDNIEYCDIQTLLKSGTFRYET